EQPVLLIGPACASRELKSANGRVVGLCRGLRGAWWRLSGPLGLVSETDDEPLVFSFRRGGWLRRRLRVFDAGAGPMGSVLNDRVLNRWGRRLLQMRPEAKGGVFVDGREIAGRWAPAGDDTRLKFGGGLGVDPVVRMLMLAALLR